MGQESCETTKNTVKNRDTPTATESVLTKENPFNCNKFYSGLNCFYTNADSFINKFDEFRTRFTTAGISPDIIMITEVLPKNCRYTVTKPELSLEGYDMFPNDFPPSSGRGVIIYTKHNLNAVEIDIDTDFRECVFVKINLKDDNRMLVGCLYRSPSADDNCHSQLNNLLLKISSLEKNFSHILITGDFNYPNINWDTWSSSDNVGRDLLECVRDCYFYQLVDKPNRYRVGQEPSLLDLVLTNDNNYIDSIEYQDPLGHSDHAVLLFSFKCGFNSVDSKSVKYSYFKADYEGMRRQLKLDWETLLRDQDTTTMIDTFMTQLVKSMEECIPKRKLSNKKFKTPLSQEVRRSIKRKHRAWERYQSNRDNTSYRNYTKARNKVKSLVLKDRKNRERQIAESAKTNCKTFWSYINSKRKTKSGVSELHHKVDGVSCVATTDAEKADVLAEFFTSVFTQEDDFDLPGMAECTFGSKDEFKPEEVRLLLKSLDTSKSPGPDLVHPKVLYELAEVIDIPLCLIFNSSLGSGVVPEEWRIGQISALFKKGSKKLASNYRPVSLTSIICKLMEKLVRKRIVEHMNEKDLFSDRQFGFIGGRSTSLQLLKVLDHWTSILDEGGHIDVIYTDFMKAFDKVPHKRLLGKLQSYGVDQLLCRWVKGFLADRRQRVQVNGTFSKWHKVTSGIPQGSVLGPILFVIFINDLPDSVLSEVFMFADDTKLYRTIQDQSDITQLQDDIDNAFNWSAEWLLRFHPDKCKVLPISNKPIDQQDRYRMSTYDGASVVLETVESEKDVGVTIDSKLKFEQHIQSKVNKANQIVGLIRRSFKYLDYKTFCLLFKALVRPHLEYAATVWNPHLKKHIEIVENVQRRATKLLPNLHDKTYEERLQILKLPTLRFRRMRGDIIETFKILKGIYDPRTTKELLRVSTNNITRGNSLKLEKTRSKLQVRRNFFTNRVVNVWNSLPEDVITANNVKQFERRLDKFWRGHPMMHDHNYNTPDFTAFKPARRDGGMDGSEDDIEPHTEE